MTDRWRVASLAGLLCCASPASAAPVALPVLDPSDRWVAFMLERGEPEVRLHGVLREYVRAHEELLPVQRSLSAIVREEEKAPDGKTTTVIDLRHWNPHRATLLEACRASEHCAGLFVAQLDALGRHVGELMATLRDADTATREDLLLSAGAATAAAADLCDIAVDANVYLVRGECPALGTGAYWDVAGYVWWQLEHPLAIAFAGQASATRRWWNYTAPANEKKPTAIPDYWQPLQADRLDLARILYLQEFLVPAWQAREAATADHKAAAVPALRNAMAVTAELSAQGGDPGSARNWLSALAEMPPPPAGTDVCEEQLAVARTDAWLSHQAGRAPDALLAIEALVGQGCGIANLSALVARLALQRGERDLAAQVAARGMAYCETSARCYTRNRARLMELRAIATGRLPDLQRQAGYWLGQGAERALTGEERATVLALAATAASHGERGAALARELYVAIDDQVQSMLRDPLMGAAAPLARQNLARYDDLRRRRVLADFLAGTQYGVGDLEVLRAQSLLHRFRQKRWERDFADVRDDAARAEFEAGMARLAEARAGIPQLNVTHPVERVVRAEMSMWMASAEQFLRDMYFERLACQASGWSHCDKPRFAPAGTLDSHERSATGNWFAGNNRKALRNGEVYLGWLRVPGGYLEVLVQPYNVDPQLRFLADTPAVTSALALYGRLLASGAGATRGLRVIAPPPVDGQGVVLGKQPVWRQQDGRFLVADSAPPGAVRVRSVRELSDVLYAHFLQAHRRVWQDADVLVLGPDADLALLPFESLTYDGAPVLEMIDIHYVQSLAVHAEIRERQQTRVRRDRLLSVADPLYLPGIDAIPWSPLPGTRRESDRLAALFPAHQRLLGAEAARPRLLAMNETQSLRDFGVLHFATHGYADNQRSALVLSNDQGAEASYLADDDVSLLQLDSDLVLLSACDTGVGRTVSGEGVVGLPYAFFMAGNRNTLMSLWPVDDAGTAVFIPEFMRRVREGQDAVAALNDTKRAFLRGEHGKAWSDPRIWAAFVLYGAAGKQE